jgi:hypothetical protein
MRSLAGTLSLHHDQCRPYSRSVLGVAGQCFSISFTPHFDDLFSLSFTLLILLLPCAAVKFSSPPPNPPPLLCTHCSIWQSNHGFFSFLKCSLNHLDFNLEAIFQIWMEDTFICCKPCWFFDFLFHGRSKLCSPHPRECCFFAGHLEGGIGVRQFIQPLLLRTECASTASAWKCSRVFSGFLASTAHSSDGECLSWQNSRQSILTGIHPVCPNYPFLCTMLAYTKSHSFPFVVLCVLFL